MLYANARCTAVLCFRPIESAGSRRSFCGLALSIGRKQRTLSSLCVRSVHASGSKPQTSVCKAWLTRVIATAACMPTSTRMEDTASELAMRRCSAESVEPTAPIQSGPTGAVCVRLSRRRVGSLCSWGAVMVSLQQVIVGEYNSLKKYCCRPCK